MFDLVKERNKAMKHAYAFARSGNAQWTQLWMDRAADFWPVTTRQFNYAHKLLNQAYARQWPKGPIRQTLSNSDR